MSETEGRHVHPGPQKTHEGLQKVGGQVARFGLEEKEVGGESEKCLVV